LSRPAMREGGWPEQTRPIVNRCERGDFCMVESARGHLIDNKHCLGYLERASRRFRLRGAWSSRRGAKDTTCRRSSAARVSIASLGDGSLMVAMFTLHGRWRVRIHSASLGSTVASTLCINAGFIGVFPSSTPRGLTSPRRGCMALAIVQRIPKGAELRLSLAPTKAQNCAGIVIGLRFP
jgi:hypothetical protein